MRTGHKASKMSNKQMNASYHPLYLHSRNFWLNWMDPIRHQHNRWKQCRLLDLYISPSLSNTWGLVLILWNSAFILVGKLRAYSRGERYIETIASLDQWSLTIENHWSQWLKDPKTIEKPLKPMVWGLEII